MNKTTALIEKIMADFSLRTCLKGENCIPVRYLWTDAFAVCNYLCLFIKTGDVSYKDDALLLIDQVHHILGKHRMDDARRGWISGLEETEGEKYPTIGGLRIGKKNSERKRDEPFDEKAEWEQDGQYFHYLTKWMHALNLTAQITGNPKYNIWAVELAKTAYEKFTYTALDHTKRMYWKMSIDLTYPLVTSMGQHDAIDGFVTYLELAKAVMRNNIDLNLNDQISSLFQISQTMNMDSSDPLGIGGLLSNACIFTQFIAETKMVDLSKMLLSLLASSLKGIELFMQTDTLRYPANYRLAFRELGLSIGLHGIEKMQKVIKENSHSFTNYIALNSKLDDLKIYLPIYDIIENYWLKSENQKSSSWTEHININSVMLATSLDSECFLSVKLN